MRKHRLVAAAALTLGLTAGLAPACSGAGATCAGAATGAVVERGGGGGAGSSGAHSSGGGHASTGGGAARGSGTPAGYSGSKTGPAKAPGYSGARPNTYTNPATGTKTQVRLPASVGTRYSYAGHAYTYHPEQYWMARTLDPNNPYDTRNYGNPYSPWYHYRLAVHC